MSTNTTTKSPPQPPPSFSYTPASLLEAADRLNANSAKIWDRVATIPPHQATFSAAIQPLIDDENARSAQGRILYFLSTTSPDKDIRAASKQADIALKHDVIGRFARADVFAVVKAVAERPDIADLPAESRVYLRKMSAEFVGNGLAIEDPDHRARLKEVNLRLTELQTQFSSNLNGDVSGIWLTAQELDGLAPVILERFKRDEEGRYFVNFKRPNLNAVLGSVHSAGVRRKYYVAWDNRLGDSNGPLMYESLRLRREAALLLGFPNFAELKDQERMLSAERVAAFLDSIQKPLQSVAEVEIKALSELKAAHLETLSAEQKDDSSTDAIFRWDSEYYKRLAKFQKAEVDVDKVSEYFSFQLILPKLLDVFSLLFGLRFAELSTKEAAVDVWHEDVKVWTVWDDEEGGGNFLGYLYVDPYPRDGKYGHVGTYAVQLVSIVKPPLGRAHRRSRKTNDPTQRATSSQMAHDNTQRRLWWPTILHQHSRVPLDEIPRRRESVP